MTTKTTTALRRKPRGIHPKVAPAQQSSGRNVAVLPEYLEAHEVQAILATAPDARARLLMLLQWRAGLRVSEALALEAADLSLDTGQPTIRVRSGKGRRSRIVPVHPELQNALIAVLKFAGVGPGPLIPVDRSTAWRWVQEARKRAVNLGGLARGPESRHPHVPAQLREAFVASRRSHKLFEPLAGPPVY